MFVFMMAMALCAGVCGALQSPTNASLGRSIGAFEASLVSFIGGDICLLVVVLLFGDGDLSRLFTVPWWQFMGGVYGSFLIIVITLSVSELGVVLSLTSILVGQLFTALIIDSCGFLQVTQTPISWLRVVGFLLILAGLICVMLGKRRLEAAERAGQSERVRDASRARVTLAITFCLIAGMGAAAQAPTNAALATTVGQLEAALVNFTCGTIVVAVVVLLTTHRREKDWRSVRPWQLLGGPYGAFVVAASLTATPVVGPCVLAACNMFGQLGFGFVIDSYGLIRCKRRPMNGLKWLGALCFTVGIILAALSKVM